MSNKATLEMTMLMTPDKANFSGKVHGGQMLKLMDEAAYACAARYAGCYVVTLAIDKVLFKQAINVGDLVTIYATVNYTGHTSMEIGIKVIAEDLKNKIKRHSISCYFTMVAMCDQGIPIKVPQLVIKTKDQKRRWNEALLRKKMNIEKLKI